MKIKKEKDRIVQWIKDQMYENGGKKIVVGLSGGKDSSVVAALSVEAVGKENVVGVSMPEGYWDIEKTPDVRDAKRVADHLGIEFMIKDITPIVAPFSWTEGQARINVAPRIRMTMLYAVAQTIGNARVTCNSNLSEDTMGYATKYGDTAGDLAPIMHLTVREVVELGKELGLPKDLVEREPADGLTGKTDEEVLGVTYNQIDDYLLKGTSGDREVDKKIGRAEEYNKHKLKTIPNMKK